MLFSLSGSFKFSGSQSTICKDNPFGTNLRRHWSVSFYAALEQGRFMNSKQGPKFNIRLASNTTSNRAFA